MPLKTIATGRGLMGGGGAVAPTYADKIEGYNPLAYWILGEASGTTAVCQINALQNGTYNSDVAGWPPGTGIGDGNTAPFFDGSNDVIDAFSATLAAAAGNSTVGTLMQWVRVANVGVWTDGAWRLSFYAISGDSQETLDFRRMTGNGQYRQLYEAGGVSEAVTTAGLSTVAWFCALMTWDINAGVNGEVKMYLGGVQTGATQTALGAWVGNLAQIWIGALNATPLGQWHGWLAHTALWGRVLTGGEITAAASPTP